MRRIAWLLCLSACAPATGWQRSDARVCDDDAPAVVCVHAWPDQAVEVELGDVTVLPEECAVAPKGGGSMKVTWRDGRGDAHHRRVRVPKATRTELALAQDGELHVARRERCGGAMPVWVP